MFSKSKEQSRKTAVTSGKRKRKPSTNVIDSIVSNGYDSLKRKSQKSCTQRTKSVAVISSNNASQSQSAEEDNNVNLEGVDDKDSEGGIKINEIQSLHQVTSNNSSVHSQQVLSEARGTVDLLPAGRGSNTNASLSIGTRTNDSPLHSNTFVPPIHNDFNGRRLVGSQQTADKFDRSVLLSLEKKLGDIVKAEVLKAVTSLSGKVNSIEENISRSVRDVIKDRLEGMETSIEIIKNDVKELNSNDGKRLMTSSKSGKQTVVDTKIEKFSFLYDRLLIVHVTEKCVIGRSGKLVFDENAGTFIENAAFAVRSMLFAKRPRDKKVEFLTEAGQQYCALRRAMARTALTHIEQDKFMRFKPPTDSSTSSASSRGKTDRRIPRPFWCEPRFVRNEHLDEIKRRLETLQTQDKKVKKENEDFEENQEIALAVAKKIFNLVTVILTRSRERGKKCIFEQIGFLFTNWASFGIPLQQDKTEFIWGSEENEDEDLDLNTIPYAKAADLSSADEEKKKIKRENMKSWNKILSDNNTFILLASYEVSIRRERENKTEQMLEDMQDDEVGTMKTGSQQDTNHVNDHISSSPDDESVLSKQTEFTDEEVEKYVRQVSDGEVTTMYRAFNILDISAQFLSTYCGSKVSDLGYDIFSSTPNSFKVIYAIASLLKTWTRGLVEGFRQAGASAFIESDDTITDCDIIDYRLSKMFPCHSKMHSTLYRSCLGISKEEFNDDCLEEKMRDLFASYRKLNSGNDDDAVKNDEDPSNAGDISDPLASDVEGNDDDDDYTV